MKKMMLFIIIGISIFIVNNAYPQSTIKEYSQNKIQEIMVSQHTKEGNFIFIVIPATIEHLILTDYPSWIEKRYSLKKIISEAKKTKRVYEKANVIMATLSIAFSGDWDSKGKTSLEIPRDIADYIFLENEHGKFVRCKEAKVPIWNTVGTFKETIVILLTFPARFPDTKESIFAHTKIIKFVIGGLGIKSDVFEYKIPLSNLFLDAPPEIKEIYYDIDLWKR